MSMILHDRKLVEGGQPNNHFKMWREERTQALYTSARPGEEDNCSKRESVWGSDVYDISMRAKGLHI